MNIFNIISPIELLSCISSITGALCSSLLVKEVDKKGVLKFKLDVQSVTICPSSNAVLYTIPSKQPTTFVASIPSRIVGANGIDDV